MENTNHKINYSSIVNNIHSGITGPVVMDENADKLPRYSLWHMNPELTAFQVWTEINMIEPSGQVINIYQAISRCQL